MSHNTTQPLIAVVNGPNLNLVGQGREPGIYGNQAIEPYVRSLEPAFPGVRITCWQSNHEGALIDELQRLHFAGAAAVVLNAGALTHYSRALADCIAGIAVPVVEVHMSDTAKREPWRRVSVIREACAATIQGHGLESYRMAIEWIVAHVIE